MVGLLGHTWATVVASHPAVQVNIGQRGAETGGGLLRNPEVWRGRAHPTRALEGGGPGEGRVQSACREWRQSQSVLVFVPRAAEQSSTLGGADHGGRKWGHGAGQAVSSGAPPRVGRAGCQLSLPAVCLPGLYVPISSFRTMVVLICVHSPDLCEGPTSPHSPSLSTVEWPGHSSGHGRGQRGGLQSGDRQLETAHLTQHPTSLVDSGGPEAGVQPSHVLVCI